MIDYKEYLFHVNRDKEIMVPSEPDGGRLYHYTSSAGFCGIVGSNKLWATHFQFMNDGSEMEYGSNLIRAELDALVESRKEDKETYAGIVSRLKTKIDQAATYFPPYVFCMCENDDLLSQWREYGARSASYSIGFSAAGLVEITKSRTGTALFPVIYDEVQQKEMVKHFVMASHEYAVEKSTELQDDSLLDEFLDLAAALASYIAVRLKHPAFRHEKEWRLYYFSQAETKVEETRFRPTDMGVTPYIEIPALTGKTLPIVSVTVGPSQHQSAALHSAWMMMDERHSSVMSCQTWARQTRPPTTTGRLLM